MSRALALLLLLVLIAACGQADAPSHSTDADPTGAEATPAESEPAALEGQVAFVAGMDPQIHILDLASGESRQLTRLRPEHAELRAEGPMRPVLSCGFGPTSLTWSPDGSLLAFAYGGCETVLYLVDLEGNLTRVGDGRSPAWSPDGERLLFSPNAPWCADPSGCGEAPAPGAWSLQVVDVAGDKAPAPLSLDPMLTSAGQPHFSPDGDRIAYTGPPPEDDIDPETFGAAYVMAADGSAPRLVAVGAWSPGWLADGRLLIVQEKTGDLHAIDLETNASTPLGGDVGRAAASPDGTLLLLTSSHPETGASSVTMTTIAGEAVARRPGFPAAWSPDSSVAVIVESDDQRAALAFVGRDGAGLGRYPLPESSSVSDVAWRPGS